MSDKKKASFQELTQPALNYQQAQEEFARAWADYMASTMAPIDWLTPSTGTIAKSVQAVQSGFEKSLRLFSEESRVGLDLFKQAIGATNSAPPEFQRLLEGSLAGLRSGAQAMIHLNTKAVEWWAQLLSAGSQLHRNGQNGKK